MITNTAVPTSHYVYMRQSTTDRYDWRYAFKRDAHSNVYEIGRVLASNEPDAQGKIYHKTSTIGRRTCLTPILKDIEKCS